MVVVVDVAAAAVAAAAADVFRVSPQLLGVGVAVSDTILLICCCRTPHWLFQYRSLILTLVRWSIHDGFASSGQQIPLSSNTSVCRQKLTACSCSVSLVTGHFPYTRNREPQLNSKAQTRKPRILNSEPFYPESQTPKLSTRVAIVRASLLVHCPGYRPVLASGLSGLLGGGSRKRQIYHPGASCVTPCGPGCVEQIPRW